MSSQQKTKEKPTWGIKGVNTYFPVTDSITSIPSAYYRLIETSSRILFHITPICSDELMTVKDSAIDYILKEVEGFLGARKYYQHYRLSFRRGYMLHGPAGGGKSSIINLIARMVIIQNGIVFICDNPRVLAEALRQIREIEPDRLIVCIFEDIEVLITDYEEHILELLDGEAAVNNVLNLATTNYPEKLDKRLIARPRRFDQVIQVDLPSDSMRQSYFTHKLLLSPDEAADWAAQTHGFSFAAMTELVARVKCLGQSFQQAIEQIHSVLYEKKSSHKYKLTEKPVGFAQL